MLHAQDQHAKKKLSRRLNDFIQENRMIVIIIAIVLLLVPIGYFIYQQIANKINSDAGMSLFELEEKYRKMEAETDAEKKKAVLSEVVALSDSVIASYQGTHAGQRALEIRLTINRAKIALPDTQNKNDIVKSVLADAVRIASGPSGNIMTPKYQMFAASFIENIPGLAESDASGAITVKFEDILPLVPDTFSIVMGKKAESFTDLSYGFYAYCAQNNVHSIYILEALFNAGRLAEARGDLSQAIAYYEQLERDYANNNWTNLAINRRIALQPEEKKE
ncbi:MAG: hypothetical protein EHM28_10500 [Spirochaetaceae bacterium]|nr:MAG: hypothetical protein EHM28_10500 [Spirochaetaceae bacterium]